MASIKDLKRMCNNYPKCKNCPMSEYMCAPECAPEDLPDNADEIVDKWVAEHPAKTYAMDFFGKFPSAPKKENGCPKICLLNIYGGKKACVLGHHDCYKCWNSEMEENNND